MLPEALKHVTSTSKASQRNEETQIREFKRRSKHLCKSEYVCIGNKRQYLIKVINSFASFKKQFYDDHLDISDRTLKCMRKKISNYVQHSKGLPSNSRQVVTMWYCTSK